MLAEVYVKERGDTFIFKVKEQLWPDCRAGAGHGLQVVNEGHTTAHTDVHYLKADMISLSNLQLDHSPEL